MVEVYNITARFSDRTGKLSLLLCYVFKDNHSYSKSGVLRGLHAQPGMGKLVSVISGEIFDVAVDIRPTSKTFGKWYGIVLNEETRTGFWIPDGFLHGFYVSIFLFTFYSSNFIGYILR